MRKAGRRCAFHAAFAGNRAAAARCIKQSRYSLQILSRYGESLECYQRALALSPGYVSAYFNCGNLLHDIGRYDEAVSAYRKAIALRPDYAYAYVNCSNSLRELGRHDEALAAYRNALALDPDYVPAYANQAFLYMEQGLLDEARRSLDEALLRNPDHVESHQMLLTLGNYDEGGHGSGNCCRFMSAGRTLLWKSG